MGNLFCSGHSWSPFGDLMVAGGVVLDGLLNHHAAPYMFVYEPTRPSAPFPANGHTQPLYPGAIGNWTQMPDLAVLRYYPTVVTTHRLTRTNPTAQLRQECLVVLGGTSDPSITLDSQTTTDPQWNNFESYLISQDPTIAGQTILVPETFSPPPNNDRLLWGPGDPSMTASSSNSPFAPQTFDWLLFYPRVHLLSNGLIFYSGFVPQGALLNHDTGIQPVFDDRNPASWTQWSVGAGQPAPPPAIHHERTWRHYGSSVLYPNLPGWNDMVMRIGGLAENVGSLPLVEVCKPLAGTGANDWIGPPFVPQLVFPRHHCNAVLLPDASILVLGGNDGVAPVFKPELYKHGSGAWETQNPSSIVRDYHSTALLLPDGRVFVGGGNGRHSLPGGADYEIFEPHYLTSGQFRPQIQGISPSVGTGTQELQSGGTFVVDMGNDVWPFGVSLSKVVLMAPGSVTHHSDMHQRYVECTSVPQGHVITFTAPTETQAPRGFYMLFVLTSQGIPSEAVFVKVI